MGRAAALTFACIVVAVLVAAAAVYEIAGWNYCITSGNPWWYCLRLLGH